MESKVAIANQMFSCLFKKNTPPSWMALVSLILLFCVGFGFFLILHTSIGLLLSTTVVVLYTVSKHKAAIYVDNLVQEEKDLISFEDQESSSDQKENIAAPTPLHMHKHESTTQVVVNNNDSVISPYNQRSQVRVPGTGNTAMFDKESFAVHNNSSRLEQDCLRLVEDTYGLDRKKIISPDLLSSESECQDQDQLWNSEDSEMGWSFQYDVDHHSPDDNSDGSISDEESLIEIALPTGHCSLQQKKRESSAEALFSQQSIIREFLAEFNEEENLIEIDISMGSIKYSRFEIKA